MKLLFSIILLLSIVQVQQLRAQQYDSTYIVLELLKESKQLECHFGEPSEIKNRTITFEDSIIHCKTYKIYATSVQDQYYMKYFDQLGRVSKEGPVLIKSHKPKGLFKNVVEFYPKIGRWKEYNYLKDEVNYVDCYYNENAGERLQVLIEHDEK